MERHFQIIILQIRVAGLACPILAAANINLFDEIDLAEVAKKLYNDNLEAAKAIKNKLNLEVGDSLIADSSELGKMELCGKRPSKTKKFNPEDVDKAIPCAIVPEPDVDLKNLKDLVDLINNTKLPTPEDEIGKLNNFLACVKSAQDIMNECGKKKAEYISKYYAFKEVALLHDINHTYISTRAVAGNGFSTSYAAIAKEKDAINKQVAVLDNKITLAEFTGSPELDNLIDEKANLVNKLSVLQVNFDDLKTQFNEELLAEVNNTFESSILTGSIEDRAQTIRKQLKTENNTISNLTGFKENGKTLELFITNPEILPRLNLFLLQSLNGVKGSSFDDYFKLGNYTFIPGQGKLRVGALEYGVWKKYYSPNRLDDLFTWQEQGYTAPKPQYDDQGNALGAKSNVEIKAGNGATITKEVPTSVQNCDVDLNTAVTFLENLEPLTRSKINSLATQILNSSQVEPYMAKLKYYAKLEARLAFFDILKSTSFSGISVNKFESFNPNEFLIEQKISNSIFERLQLELNGIVKIIEEANVCIEKQTKAIEDCGKNYSGKSGSGEDSAALEKKCKELLGSDPLGLKGSNGCPDYTKNCYWKEYTKIMQTVSLMPIPDIEFLNKRLFRYYPVALQIPVPAALPTLAMGIPDAVISVPLPFLWVHLLTIQTPIGLFVFWIGASGGIIPNVYIMLIDEKQQAIFAVTLKGPSAIPSPSLNISDLDKKSLLDLFPNLDLIKIDLTKFPGTLLSGSTRLDVTKPDSSKTVIDNIKGKIKKSVDELVIPNPPVFGGNSPTAKDVQGFIKEALAFANCENSDLISAALKAVIETLINSLDGLDIPGIKIPRDSKGLMMELPDALAMLDTINSLISTVKTAPGDAQKLLKEIGLAINSPLDVNAKVKELVRANTATATSQGIFSKYDELIDTLEAEIDPADPDAAKKRVDAVKQLLVDQIKSALDSITPEDLGFVSVADVLSSLPVPCYTSVPLPAMPPAITVALEFIKSIPGLLLALADEAIEAALSLIIDFLVPLPSAEELFQLGINLLLDLLPPLVLPIDISVSLLKEVKKALINFIKRFTVRSPKPGLAVQIEIPGSMILNIIKEALKAFLSALGNFVECYVGKICESLGDPEIASKIATILNMIKLLFGVDLNQIAGPDIKAFLFTLLETIAFPALDALGTIIDAASKISAPYVSIIKQFLTPEIPKPEGPFLELDPMVIKEYIDPILKGATKFASDNIPFPVILLGCAFTPTRAVLTKIDPTKSHEKLPLWEGLSLKNIPYLIWLDQLVATAQRNALLGSDYVAPYTSL